MNDNFCKPEENSYNFEEHWNNAYLKTPTKSLGWYEENPEDLEHGSVIDVEFNSGVIERTLSDGTKRTIGKRLGIDEIVDEYKKRNMG